MGGVHDDYAAPQVRDSSGVRQLSRRNLDKHALKSEQALGLRNERLQGRVAFQQRGNGGGLLHGQRWVRGELMHVILVSNRLAQAKSLTVSVSQLGIAIFAALMIVALASTLLSYLTLRHADALKLPFVQGLVQRLTERDADRHQAFARENINALAIKLGEMQARLIRLDTLGERLISLANLKPLKFAETPGRGGAVADANSSARPLSFGELTQELEQLSLRLDERGDVLRLFEDELLREKTRGKLLPSANPISAPYLVSGFGRRIDPFNGRGAMHEGVDFAAPAGTPILAAAGGIVVVAAAHPAYGNMVEIDHGRGLSTRYAHASKLLVRAGALIRPGQTIAEVGSTGHSTGPHLHFEVRQDGAAQNPAKFLTARFR